MFKIGEHIIYGLNGICRVEEIMPSPYDPTDQRLFYKLIPLQNATSVTICAPVENEHVAMRRLMTPQEVEGLISRMPEIGLLQIPVERERRDIYRDTVKSLTPEGYVRLIKTIAKRKEELSVARKHFPITDAEYGRLAKHMLYSEVAYVLGMHEEQIEAYIADRLAKAE